mmetsp:Transcript_13748/g.37624  ORF Transcript_13748/g.37624 Transcript_13748/m.37624 type:complete len:122 (-) Transcript_13748:1101-1466(-)
MEASRWRSVQGVAETATAAATAAAALVVDSYVTAAPIEVVDAGVFVEVSLTVDASLAVTVLVPLQVLALGHVMMVAVQESARMLMPPEAETWTRFPSQSSSRQVDGSNRPPVHPCSASKTR